MQYVWFSINYHWKKVEDNLSDFKAKVIQNIGECRTIISKC